MPELVTYQWLVQCRCNLTLDRLRGIETIELARKFTGLHWWLRPEVLEAALKEIEGEVDNDYRPIWLKPLPDLPRKLGSCWVVFVPDWKPGDLPLLREALLLPFCWQEAKRRAGLDARSEPSDHSERLPEGVRRTAAEIVNEIPDPRPERTWKLDLAREPWPFGGLAGFDFHGFENMKIESGWASLSSGLIAAIHGSQVQTDVWASAIWKSGVLHNVDGIEKKLKLAHDWNATRFFVSPGQDRDAKNVVSRWSPSLQIETLGPDPRRDRDLRFESPVEAALKPLTDVFGTKPDVRAPLQERADWFLGYARTGDANRYYFEALIDDVACSVRAKLTTMAPGLVLTEARLITIVSPSLVSLLGALAIRPSACLLLATRDDPCWSGDQIDDRIQEFKQKTNESRQLAALPKTRFHVGKFARRDDYQKVFAELLDEFEGRHPNGSMITDLNSGSSRMKLHLLQEALRRGSRLLVIDHDFSEERGRYIPDTEVPELFRQEALATAAVLKTDFDHHD